MTAPVRGRYAAAWCVALCLWCGLAVDPSSAQAQARPPRDAAAVERNVGTALIAGIVQAVGQDARPVRRALVTLAGSGLPHSLQAVTDDAGRFAFPELSAGRYTLTAEKPAYVKSYYGSRRAGRGPATPVALGDGQPLTGIVIGLLRGAAIEGTVLDDNGVPLSSAQVTVLQSVMANGERRLVNPPGARWVTTDDRGRYRIYGLPPGDYAVRASGGPIPGSGARLTTPAVVSAAVGASQEGRPDAEIKGPAVARGTAYFPGVSDAAAAELVTLGPAEERPSIDITVRLVRVSRINGLAVDGGGQPLWNMLVGLANLSTTSMWSSPGAVRPGRDGRFTLPSMRPGRYLFFGRATASADTPATPASQLPLWTETEVVVNEEESVDVVLQFLPGAGVSGRISADRADAPLDLSKMRLTLRPGPTIAGAAVGLPPISPQADGTFAFAGVAPGKYRLTLAGGDPWVLRSAMAEGRDVLDEPLEVQPGRNVPDLKVTLTDRPAGISGTLVDALGRPAPEYAIVVFSTDRAHWTTAPRRISGVVKVGTDGAFTVRGLPPGEYYLTALTDLDPSQLTDPTVLDQLATTSLRIVLGEGERKVQNLKLPQ